MCATTLYTETNKKWYMSKVKFLLYSSNKRKDGSYPVCLRVAKGNKVKYINLGLSAMQHQWNIESQRFKKDKRINPEHEKQNSLLNVYDERVSNILRIAKKNSISGAIY